MSGPSGDPWSAAPADPRRPLPRLSAEGFRTALGNVMAGLGVTHGVQAAMAGAAGALRVQARVDSYFQGFSAKYTVNGVQVKAAPFFRMANGAAGGSEPLKAKVFAVTGRRSGAFNMAVHMCAYGRCTAQQLQMVTQALIDKGKLKEVRDKYDAMPEAEFRKWHGGATRPLSDENAIKLMQYDYGLGIDCAGYVQQAFLAVHGGSRKTWGFHERIGYEDLSDLKGNRAFERTTTPVGAQPGDLIFLSPPVRGDVGHTVLVRDRQELSAAEAKGLSGLDRFAEPADKVHRIEVHGSWGAGYGNLDKGGLQSRVFLYNEVTDQWADVEGTTVVQHPKGPYDHPLEGIYHPKRR